MKDGTAWVSGAKIRSFLQTNVMQGMFFYVCLCFFVENEKNGRRVQSVLFVFRIFADMCGFGAVPVTYICLIFIT